MRLFETNSLQPIINGKSIAIVGNAVPSKNYSDLIDSHDLVWRINHFYNYDSGLVGKRVDLICTIPTTAWLEVPYDKKHVNEINYYRPSIILFRMWDRVNWPMFQQVYANCNVYLLKDNLTLSGRLEALTSGGLSLYYPLNKFKNCKVTFFGFSNNRQFMQYLCREAKHYNNVYYEELELRQQIFKGDTTNNVQFIL